MNLQICVPYEKCPFNCPMCIARGRKVFENLYDTDYQKYFDTLKAIRDSNKYDYFILTGSTDPTLNRLWLEDVINFLFVNGNNKIELQTRNYNLKNYNLGGLFTLAYSVSTVRDYLKSWRFRKIEKNNRLVILLTKEFEFLNRGNFDSMGYNQITFKKLQPSKDDNTNKWIEENQTLTFDNVYGIIDLFNGSDVSIRLDSNCQDSHGRYDIFREDGNIYETWDAETPIFGDQR